MKKLLKLFCLFVTLAHSADLFAQSVTTKSISFTLEEVTEMFMPPDLRMNIEFVDANRNNILEAEETGEIRLNISNNGGKADDVKVTVTPLTKSNTGIQLKQSVFTMKIDKESNSVVNIPISADLNTVTGFTKLAITVTEPMGYDINATVELSTFAYQKPKLVISGVEISDSGKDLRAFNGRPDNKLQNLDVARANVLIQNVGDGEAVDIKYVLRSKDPNIRFITQSGYATVIEGTIRDMLVGQTEELSFRLSPNAHYVNKSEYVPVYLTVTDSKGFGRMESVQVPIPFDAAAAEPMVVKVEGNREQLMASLGTKVYSEDIRVTSGAKYKDISVVPVGVPLFSDAVAVVIGAEEYLDKSIPNAPYAARDAAVMTEYFKKALGVSNVREMSNADVTNMELKKMFDPARGRLAGMVVPGKTDVFVYYSGHGVPMEDKDGKKDIKLIPYDVEKDWIRDEGFSLNDLYANLSLLNARSVTVIMDACFSGSRSSGVFESKSIANQKLVLVDAFEMDTPWLVDKNFRVFASSRGDQASFANDRSQSGLFTYFLAIGLQGEADADGNGAVTMRELVDFVSDSVHKESGGLQTPQFYGDADFVVERIK